MSGMNTTERTGAGLAAGSVLLVGGSVAASSLLEGYPVLGGQAVRYLAAGLLLAAWARLTRKPLPRPAGREWAWLAGLAAIGLAGCSVLMIRATQVADPASVGVIIGAAPLVIIIATAMTARRRPTRRVLLAAAVVTAGSAAAQFGDATGPAFSSAGLLWSAGALSGVVGTSLLAAPVLPRLGALAVTVYGCGMAGILLLAAAAVARSAGGPPILRTPSATQLTALAYLTIAVTAVVFIAWYGAIERLGVDRAGLFNGLIPVTSLAAVALTGTGTITPFRFLGALAVLVGVILGLGRAGASQAERLAQLGLDPRCRQHVAGRSRVSTEGVGIVGPEHLEPFGGLGGTFDEPESCGGVERARLQELGFPLLPLGVVAAVGEDDMDTRERAVPARPELGADEGVGGAQSRGDQRGARVAEQARGAGG